MGAGRGSTGVIAIVAFGRGLRVAQKTLFNSVSTCGLVKVVVGVTCQLLCAKSAIFLPLLRLQRLLERCLQRPSSARFARLGVCRACSQYERVKWVAGISSPDFTPHSSSIDCQISLLDSPVAAASLV